MFLVLAQVLALAILVYYKFNIPVTNSFIYSRVKLATIMIV